MITILCRTIIIYILLVGTMRILGKRQLGELEVSELITTILLSEIATMPIANQDIPISYAIIPLITIVMFEVTLSFISSRSSILKNLLSSPPSTLIYNGKINQKELIKNRISPEELISELRINNITNVSHVQYAILEQNGLLSVIPKIQHQQPTIEQLNLEEKEEGIIHIIISQGSWNEYNLKLLNKSKQEFEKYLKKKKSKVNDVFLMTIDDDNNINLVLKEKNK
ncbi:MAG: DUF421 domain-containing protein [Clostridia bacterium]|nr:DUF421 domain-containing protein [Clostridia bacterium]